MSNTASVNGALTFVNKPSFQCTCSFHQRQWISCISLIEKNHQEHLFRDLNKITLFRRNQNIKNFVVLKLVFKAKLGQLIAFKWLMHSWQSGRLWHIRERAQVMIQSSSNHLENLRLVNWWKDENKDRRGREWPNFKNRKGVACFWWKQNACVLCFKQQNCVQASSTTKKHI